MLTRLLCRSRGKRRFRLLRLRSMHRHLSHLCAAEAVRWWVVVRAYLRWALLRLSLPCHKALRRVVAARRLYRGALQTTCACPSNVKPALLTPVLTIFRQLPPALRHPPSTGRAVPCFPRCAAHAAFVCLHKADFCQTGMIVFDARFVGHGYGLRTPVATRSPSASLTGNRAQSAISEGVREHSA